MKKVLAALSLSSQGLTAIVGLIMIVLQIRLLCAGDVLVYENVAYGVIQALLKCLLFGAGIAAFVLGNICFYKQKEGLNVAHEALLVFCFAAGVSLFVCLAQENGAQPLYYLIPSLLFPTLSLVLDSLSKLPARK